MTREECLSFFVKGGGMWGITSVTSGLLAGLRCVLTTTTSGCTRVILSDLGEVQLHRHVNRAALLTLLAKPASGGRQGRGQAAESSLVTSDLMAMCNEVVRDRKGSTRGQPQESGKERCPDARGRRGRIGRHSDVGRRRRYRMIVVVWFEESE